MHAGFVSGDFLVFVSCVVGDPLPTDLSRTLESNPSPPAGASHPARAQHLLKVLRQTLADSLQPPAAVMQAATELARFLTGAEGAALALRTKGLMVCRARSGEPAPELGAQVNADSGISGECVRTGSILVCNDTANDPRVDPQVCLALGIRSIAVAPVRAATGIIGILEGFSTRPQAFGEEQIESLSGLAQIAQAAYEREIRALPPEFAAAAVKTQPPPKLISETKAGGTPIWMHFLNRLNRRYWIPAVGVAAVVLIAAWWLSRRPVTETAAKEPAAPAVNAQANSPSLAPVLPASIARLPAKPAAAKLEKKREMPEAPLTNAAQIEPERLGPEAGAVIPPATQSPKAAPTTPTDSVAENPPSITIERTGRNDLVATLGSAPDVVPTLGTRVSQGVTEGQLIHKVNPVYPMLAINQRVQGPVALDITIADDGSIREVKKVSGPPMLAVAASDAIRQWRYTPFQLDGKPVEFHERITVVFKLP